MPRGGVVNVINFIRGCEPRDPEMDLVEPVARQIELVRHHKLPATWLLQYDALQNERIVALMRGLDERQEVGGWFEVVQPLVERAGLTWRGRFPWDWHAHVGFSIGYTPEERERLADVYMEGFEELFGRLPTTVGSWFMDAHLLAYLAERYGVEASCVCKDQWGTDGYSLWGGYYGQAFYPSRENAYMPAQDAEHQIPIPLFRMLGSDPIYQYDAGSPEGGQGVITLEPVYPHGGGSPEWVRWFFDVTFRSPSLSFGYAQVGQENSFGWAAMGTGLTYQLGLVAERAKQGQLRVETLGDSARWFRETYPVTPASAICALKDWRKEKRNSVWYCSRHYRANLYWEGERFYLRDVHKFDQSYPERYLQEPCTTPNCTYDTLPIVDGFLWSSAGIQAGIHPVRREPDGSSSPLLGFDPVVTERNDQVLQILWTIRGAQPMRITMSADGMLFRCPIEGWALELAWSSERRVAVRNVEEHALHYEHKGHTYTLECTTGHFEAVEGQAIVRLCPEGERLELQLR